MSIKEEDLLHEVRLTLDNLRVHYNVGWQKNTKLEEVAFNWAHKSGRIAACVAILRDIEYD